MDRYTRSELAEIGESLATEYLRKHGFSIIQRNYHSAYGEIDTIATQQNELVFIEVKTRTNHSLKAAEDSITLNKQKCITKTAKYFLTEFPQYSNLGCRFDVIIVFYYNRDQTFKVIHQSNAFMPVFDSDCL